MPESTAAIYDRAATNWQRSEPVLLSDYTARPFLLDWCESIAGARVLDLGLERATWDARSWRVGQPRYTESTSRAR